MFQKSRERRFRKENAPDFFFFFALFYHLSESKEAKNQAEIELTINLLAHTSNHFICTISVAKSSSKKPCYTFEVTRT